MDWKGGAISGVLSKIYFVMAGIISRSEGPQLSIAEIERTRSVVSVDGILRDAKAELLLILRLSTFEIGIVYDVAGIF